MSRDENVKDTFKRILNPKEKLGYFAKDNNNCYEDYLSNEEWAKFLEEMKDKYPEAFKDYGAGKGGELVEHKSKGGKYTPPKMASIASSSRFIYLALRDNTYDKICALEKIDSGEFQFEKALEIDTMPHPANLDAAYLSKDKAIFIEAKCLEVFDEHKLLWREDYFKDNGPFFGDIPSSLKLSKDNADFTDYKEGKYIYHKIKPETFGLTGDVFHLDIKQFVCHLLGIGNTDYKEKTLVYLYFKPKGFGETYKDVYRALEEEFNTFASAGIIRAYCKKHNISLKLEYIESIK